jgi:hypothetical protein
MKMLMQRVLRLQAGRISYVGDVDVKAESTGVAGRKEFVYGRCRC